MKRTTADPTDAIARLHRYRAAATRRATAFQTFATEVAAPPILDEDMAVWATAQADYHTHYAAALGIVLGSGARQ